MSRSRIVKVALIAFVAGCGDDEGIVGVFMPGAPARIVLAQTSSAGGHVFRDSLIVDSATARFEVATCLESVGQSPCQGVDRRSGDVNLAMLDQLFATAQASDFARLRATYSRQGDVVPPDGGGSRLTITVAERTRTITWDSDAVLPELLSRYHCWLNSVRGFLGLCSN